MLTERGDTVTENALMAAALHPGTTVIRNASSNYMVQDLCFYLQALGVEVEGIGTTTLTVTGRESIDVDVDYAPSEDPIEAMSLLAAAIVTRSEITIRRAPIEFLEIESRGAGGDGLPLRPFRGVPRRQRAHPPGGPHDPPLGPGRPARQDPPHALPGAQHRQPALLRGDRGGGRGHDVPQRLGLRQPGDLPHRVQQGSAAGSPCSTRTACRSTARRRGPAPSSSARPRCGPPWSCCWPCWRARAPRCCAAPMSSTAATRTWPSG
nr:hypothetical protein [Nocardioides convexus]